MQLLGPSLVIFLQVTDFLDEALSLVELQASSIELSLEDSVSYLLVFVG